MAIHQKRRRLADELKDIGARLRLARTKAGFGSRELGEKCGYSHGLICSIERGHAKNPTLGALYKIAEALDVSWKWLITGLGESPLGDERQETSAEGNSATSQDSSASS